MSNPNEPYGQPDHGQQPYGTDPYGPTSYGPTSYGPTSYGPTSYGPTSYGPSPYGMGGVAVPHPQGTTILVLGILGIVCCALLAPVAWIMGSRADKDVRAHQGRYDNGGLVKTGKILGIVGTVYNALLILFVAFVFLFGAAVGLDESGPAEDDWSSVQYDDGF